MRTVMAVVMLAGAAVAARGEDGWTAVGRQFQDQAARQLDHAERQAREDRGAAESSRSAHERSTEARRRADQSDAEFRAKARGLGEAARRRDEHMGRNFDELDKKLREDLEAMRQQVREREARVEKLVGGLMQAAGESRPAVAGGSSSQQSATGQPSAGIQARTVTGPDGRPLLFAGVGDFVKRWWNYYVTGTEWAGPGTDAGNVQDQALGHVNNTQADPFSTFTRSNDADTNAAAAKVRQLAGWMRPVIGRDVNAWLADGGPLRLRSDAYGQRADTLDRQASILRGWAKVCEAADTIIKARGVIDYGLDPRAVLNRRASPSLVTMDLLAREAASEAARRCRDLALRSAATAEAAARVLRGVKDRTLVPLERSTHPTQAPSVPARLP